MVTTVGNLDGSNNTLGGTDGVAVESGTGKFRKVTPGTLPSTETTVSQARPSSVIEGPPGPRGPKGDPGLITVKGTEDGVETFKSYNASNATLILKNLIAGSNVRIVEDENGSLVISSTGSSGGGGGDGASIDKVEINSSGHLIVYYTDGTFEDVGKVVGEDGAQGPQGEQGPQGPAGQDGVGVVEGPVAGVPLYQSFSEGTLLMKSIEAGSNVTLTEQDGVITISSTGSGGPEGKGINSVDVNEEGHLIVTYTDLTTHDAGYAVGPAGQDGNIVSVSKDGEEVLGLPSILNFVGAGVSVTANGSTATVNIPGGGGGGSQPSILRKSFRLDYNGSTTIIEGQATITPLEGTDDWTFTFSEGNTILITHNLNARPLWMIPTGWDGMRYRPTPLSPAGHRMEYSDMNSIIIHSANSASTGAGNGAVGNFVIFDIFFIV